MGQLVWIQILPNRDGDVLNGQAAQRRGLVRFIDELARDLEQGYCHDDGRKRQGARERWDG